MSRYNASPLIQARLKPGFALPRNDLGEVLETLGIKLFVRERTLAQHVYWSLNTGLIASIDEYGSATIDQIVKSTSLTEVGADSLLGVLCALGIVSRTETESYELSDIGRDFFVPRSPYCIVDHIEGAGYPIPRSYLQQRSRLLTWFRLRLQMQFSPAIRHGSLRRLSNQHARNLPACVAAVRTGEFRDVQTMVDIAGGSGTFAIPLAWEYPSMRVVLTDVPRALRGVRAILSSHGLEDRIALKGFDAFVQPWDLPSCDGMFVGNFLHGFDDVACLKVLQEAHSRLSPGGQLWVHEMLWNDNRDGPLITALWHASMRGFGPGRQRTGREISRLLEATGFEGIRTVKPGGAYALIAGRKPW